MGTKIPSSSISSSSFPTSNLIKIYNLTTFCKMIAVYLQMGLFHASMQLKISPTPAAWKVFKLCLLFSLSVLPSFAISFIWCGCEANMSGHAEGCTGCCGMQMPSCRLCLFSNDRQVCHWSLGWRCAYRLGVGCCSAVLPLCSLLHCNHSDEFVSFHNKTDNKDVAKSFMEPKGGLLVDISVL